MRLAHPLTVALTATLAAAHQAVLSSPGLTTWSNKQATACACLLTPSQMEGPFYLDYALKRSNLIEDRSGLPVHLTLRVFDVRDGCAALPGAWVDIWSADAAGVYSGYGEEAELSLHKRDWTMPDWFPKRPPGGPHGPGGPPPGGPGGHAPVENNATFLRGVQETDAAGSVTFVTVYPGWYPGRTNHIHIKVHAPVWDLPDGHNTTHGHTTQLYFSESANDRVATSVPYSDNDVERTPNDRDFLFKQMKGMNVLNATYVGALQGNGYVVATIDLGIDRWW